MTNSEGYDGAATPLNSGYKETSVDDIVAAVEMPREASVEDLDRVHLKTPPTTPGDSTPRSTPLSTPLSSPQRTPQVGHQQQFGRTPGTPSQTSHSSVERDG